MDGAHFIAALAGALLHALGNAAIEACANPRQALAAQRASANLLLTDDFSGITHAAGLMCYLCTRFVPGALPTIRIQPPARGPRRDSCVTSDGRGRMPKRGSTWTRRTSLGHSPPAV